MPDVAMHVLNIGQGIADATVHSRDLTFARLCWLWFRKRGPRRGPGAFRFPFGTVRYLDAWSLQFMYREIFVERVYDMRGLGDRPVILDCGANIGLATIRLKQLHPAARVVAYEADPAIAGVLRANMEGLGLRDVEVVAAAVGDRTGRIAFRPDGVVGGSAVDGGEATVDSVRLADRIDGPVDLLKLDIEGSEYCLIRDLCATGAIASIRSIICEVHGRGEQPEPIGRLWQDLADAGFHVALRWAAAGDYLPGPKGESPFHGLASSQYLAHIYAWRR